MVKFRHINDEVLSIGLICAVALTPILISLLVALIFYCFARRPITRRPTEQEKKEADYKAQKRIMAVEVIEESADEGSKEAKKKKKRKKNAVAARSDEKIKNKSNEPKTGKQPSKEAKEQDSMPEPERSKTPIPPMPSALASGGNDNQQKDDKEGGEDEEYEKVEAKTPAGNEDYEKVD